MVQKKIFFFCKKKWRFFFFSNPAVNYCKDASWIRTYYPFWDYDCNNTYASVINTLSSYSNAYFRYLLTKNLNGQLGQTDNEDLEDQMVRWWDNRSTGRWGDQWVIVYISSALFQFSSQQYEQKTSSFTCIQCIRPFSHCFVRSNKAFFASSRSNTGQWWKLALF